MFGFEPTGEADDCYWGVSDDDGVLLDSHRQEGPGQVRILVRPGAQELELRGCGEINLGGVAGPDAVGYPALSGTIVGDGVWRAGVDFRRPPSGASGASPDRYVFDFAPVDDAAVCVWALLDEGGNFFSDDFTVGRVRGPSRVVLFTTSDTYELEIQGCGNVDLGGLTGPDAVPYPSRLGTQLGEGVWRVGEDLPVVEPETTHEYVIAVPRRDYPYECSWGTYTQEGLTEEFQFIEILPHHEVRFATPTATVNVRLTEDSYELGLFDCGEHDFTSPEVVPAE